MKDRWTKDHRSYEQRFLTGCSVPVMVGMLTSIGTSHAVQEEPRITTVAGNGQWGNYVSGRPPKEQALKLVTDIDVDEAGRLYIADQSQGLVFLVRPDQPDQRMTYVAGTLCTGQSCFDWWRRLGYPVGIDAATVDRRMFQLYVADAWDHVVRRYLNDSPIRADDYFEWPERPFIGMRGVNGYSGDGGDPGYARLAGPTDVAIGPSPDARAFVADRGNNRVRVVAQNADGSPTIDTYGGTGDASTSGDGGPATRAAIVGPKRLAIDSTGNLFISTSDHRVRKISRDGTIITVAGTGTPGYSGDGGPAAVAQLNEPTGLSVDRDGSLYIADSGNHVIRRIVATGQITTVVGTGRPAYSGDGGTPREAALNNPTAVSVDAAGALYIADSGNYRIRRVTGLPSLGSPPMWMSDTPADTSRFDVLPGDTATFTLVTADPDGEAPRLRFSFERPSGASRRMPDFVTCSSPEIQNGTVRQSCTVRPTSNVLAVMKVVATDSTGQRSEERRFLIGGSPFKYIALGDSYSAGEGVDPYFRDGYHDNGTQTGTVDNRCHRSTRAYAESVTIPGETAPVYAQASGLGDSGTGRRSVNKYGSDLNWRLSATKAWGFFACSGAVTKNILPSSQGGEKPPFTGGYREQGPQLDYSFVDYATDVVTLTVGGNEIGFADMLALCGAKPGEDKDCLTAVVDAIPFERAVEARIAALRNTLQTLYRAIKAYTFNAKLVVLGYPLPFPDTFAEQTCPELSTFDYSPGEQEAIRRLGRTLNRAIKEEAEAAGAVFLDVAAAFESHEVCGDGDRWMNGVSLTVNPTRSGVDDETFHPNQIGHSTMATLVNRALWGV